MAASEAQPEVLWLQNANIPAVLQLLRDDAVFEMPPQPTWFTGREGSGASGKPGSSPNPAVSR
jgi:hypothetical protein